MAAFRDAFAEAADASVSSERGAARGTWPTPGLFETVLARLTAPADVLERRLPRPTASVNNGATGIAYFLYRASEMLDSPDLFAAADLWIERAKREAAEAPEDAFYDRAHGLDETTVGRAALYHSAIGTRCVDGLIACSAGQQHRMQVAIDGLLRAAAVSDERADLVTGYAGQLIACAALLEAASAAGYHEESDQLLALGRRRRDDLLGGWVGIEKRVPGASEAFLGIAHGWAGVAYAILRFADAAQEPIPDQVDQMLRALREGARLGDGQAWWPLGGHNVDVWTGWCHGSSGYVLLWTYAQRFFADQELAPLAVMAGEHAWAQRPADTGHLCCGSAGQGYAFLALHRLTGDGAYVDRARQRLDHAVGFVGTRAMSPDSLYKGDLGVALLEVELSDPFLAAMPLFEPEGWP